MGGKSKSKQSSQSQNVNNSQGVQSGVNMNYGLNQSGNFGQNSAFGGSSGGGSSFNQSQQNVYGAQAPYLQDVYGAAQGAFNQGMADVQGMRPDVQNQLTDALAAAGQGYGNQMGGGFASGLADKIGPNPYIDEMKSQILNDANDIRQQSLGSLDARAAAAGMSGSSGYRDQVAGMNDDINEQALNAMTNVGYNSFDRGIQNQMQLAGMMDQNQQGAMGNLQNIQQGSMNQFNPAMMGQQMAGQYAQTIGGPTVLGNSMGGSNQFNNSFNQSQGTNMGFSNGVNVGLGMNRGVNASSGFGTSQGQGSSSSWNIQPPSFSFAG